MKKMLLLLLTVVFLAGSTPMSAVVPVRDLVKEELPVPVPKFLEGFDSEDILQLTPKAYQERTGKALSFQELVTLKKYQEELRAALPPDQEPKIDKTIYILLAVIGLGFLGIGLNTDWEGMEWIYALLMIVIGSVGGGFFGCFLFSIVGYFLQLIYSLRLMKRFYK